MKVHNKTKHKIIRIIFYITLITLIADFLLNQIEGSISNLFASHWLAYISGGLFLILLLILFNYFSFEIDHEIVHIKSKPFFLGFTKSKSDVNFEFPKRNLHHFQLSKSPFGNLLRISVQTLNGEKSTQSFSMSFINSEDSEKVLSGLEKIVADNKQNKS